MQSSHWYTVANILFWASVGALLYTYALYPLLVRLLAHGREYSGPAYTEQELPSVSILVPAHNESAVIELKISGIYRSAYPLAKVEVIVGSDASTDGTDEIVRALAKTHQRLSLVRMETRSGKASVLNRLAGLATGEVLVLTDANVLFKEDTLFELVKYFKGGDVGIIDTTMQHMGIRKQGISTAEKSYLTGEAALKHREGLLWGVMMGPFGGCYAVRRSLFPVIPPDCMADDFYVCMHVLQQRHRAMSALRAVVVEDISNDMGDEFRRKIRIATGNFQNLAAFVGLLLRPDALSFAFLSHKVLRWLGPLFIIAICLFSLPLMDTSPMNYMTVLIGAVALVLLLVDLVLRRINVHLPVARLITHFTSTNIAMFIGMVRFLGRSYTGTWTPTRRHQ
jgi:cellulose synthase/poly-beta-1,6-N-acetylglucosamine synthase-like glycosyltransferase